MMSDAYDVVVVGAGITGLSCARRLKDGGRSVLVVDRAPRAGGVIRSERIEGGAVIDHGPQSIRSGDPELIDEFRALGIEDRRTVAGAAGRNRYILWNRRLVPIPMSPGQFLRSPILTARGKLRLLTEPFHGPRAGGDESVDDFFRHRLGDQAMDRMVDPFVSGVYAGDPRLLSMRAVFPSMKDGVDQAGSLVRWGLRKGREARRLKKEGQAPPRTRPELFSFRGGLGTWTGALADALGPEGLATGVELHAVRPTGGEWLLTGLRDAAPFQVRARTVVMAVPAAVAASMLGESFPAEVRRLRDIPYAPVSTVHLVWRREDVAHPMDGFGYLCPSSQRRDVLGVLWISSLFAGRAPEGQVLTTTFVGGARNPEMGLRPEPELVAAAEREHREIMGVTGTPVAARVITHPQAIPQYEFGHLDRVAAAEQLESRAPGLFLAGSYRGGVSVPDCWKGGRAAAERVLSAPAWSSPRAERRGAPQPPEYRGLDVRRSPTVPAEGAT